MTGSHPESGGPTLQAEESSLDPHMSELQRPLRGPRMSPGQIADLGLPRLLTLACPTYVFVATTQFPATTQQLSDI